MERRWSRRPIDCEVVMSMSSMGIMRARASNISPQGLLLETGSLALRKGDVAELACITSGILGRGIRRFRVRVVHTGRGRAGVMCVDGHFNMAEFYGELPAYDESAATSSVAGFWARMSAGRL